MTESSEGGRLPFPPLMVAVAGASGSGKSTLAAELARTVPAVVNHGPPSIRSARGCAECAGLGFNDRSTIAEILLVDEPLQRLVLRNVSDAEIDAAARAGGMVNMYETGAAKVWRGETTIDEVLRATRMG